MLSFGGMVRIRARHGLLIFGSMLFYCFLSKTAPAASHQAEVALHSALGRTAAIAVVLDAASGQLLAAERPAEAARLRSSPGSVLKPFFLAAALETNQAHAETTVFCRRNLRIAGHNLPCTHPQTAAAFDAEEALAYSCNSYFAELANHFSAEEAAGILQTYGFGQQPNLFPQEALPELKTPITREQKQLLVLGIQGIRITPAQLAAGYRKLSLRLNDAQSTPALHTIEQGLKDSVRYGMAHNAETPGVTILGKTGTANDTPQGWSHGWFAGIVQIGVSKIVIVLYLPHGNGGDAAHLAQQFLLAYRNTSAR